MLLLYTISLSVEPFLVSAAICVGAVDKLSTRQGQSYRKKRAQLMCLYTHLNVEQLLQLV